VISALIACIAGSGVVACAYPLDDDGTFAASQGRAFAGPATGATGQGLDYTSQASEVALLAAADPFGVDRFSRPSSSLAATEFSYTGGTVAFAGLGIYITDAGGSVINSGFVSSTTAALIAITVDSSGNVAGIKDGSPVSVTWFNPSGVKVVGATDKYAMILLVNASAGGQTAQGTMRTTASEYLGTYDPGTTDPCGNAIG